MLRRRLKCAAARALSAMRADRLMWRLAGRSRRPVVLGYHRVVDRFDALAEASIPAMLIETRMLESHIDWIGRRCRFVTLEELGESLINGRGGDRPLAALTFDDGYSDVYHHAVPMLLRKGIPAAVFVVTDIIDTWEPPLHDRLYRLMKRLLGAAPPGAGPLHPVVRHYADLSGQNGGGEGLPRDPHAVTRHFLGSLSQARVKEMVGRLESAHPFTPAELEEFRPMSAEMIRDLARKGFTVGSHTRTHALLTNESRVRVVDEVAGSRADLEALIGRRVHHFSYPDGRFNTEIVEVLACAGYRFGYTTCRHRDASHALLTIPRMLLWQNSSVNAGGEFSPEVLECQTSALFDPLRSCRMDHR